MSAEQNRQPAGVPTGGQFATTTRPETGVALAGPSRKAVVGVNALAELDTYGVEALPSWPQELPAPSVSYAWDEDGLLETTVTTGSDSFSVFGTPTSPSCSLEDMPEEFEHIPAGAREQAAVYAYQLHDNVHSLTQQVEYAAHTPDVRATVLSLATGGDGHLEQVHDATDPRWVSPTDQGAARAETNLKAWFGTREVDETTLQDTITDLLHLARAKGITPAQFGGIFHRAQGVFRDELEHPEL